MCDWFSLALALIAGGVVAFLVIVGAWLAFRPQRYLRFFANARMEIYRSRGWTEAEINRWTRGSLIQRLLGKPYSEWLKDVIESPEAHGRALMLVRVGGAVLFGAGLILAALWLALVFYNAAACF